MILPPTVRFSVIFALPVNIIEPVISSEPVIVSEPETMIVPNETTAGVEPDASVVNVITPSEYLMFATSPLPDTRCIELSETQRSCQTADGEPKL